MAQSLSQLHLVQTATTASHSILPQDNAWKFIFRAHLKAIKFRQQSNTHHCPPYFLSKHSEPSLFCFKSNNKQNQSLSHTLAAIRCLSFLQPIQLKIQCTRAAHNTICHTQSKPDIIFYCICRVLAQANNIVYFYTYTLRQQQITSNV